MDLTDQQWKVIEPWMPSPLRRPDGRGRPWKETRAVLDGILWILKTGARWQDLPERYPSYQTCHRRFQAWVRAGVLERILRALAEDCRDRGKLDLSECFIDGTFVMAKKGGSAWEKPSGARVARSWQWQTAMVFLSPSTWPVLHHMKSPSSTRRWLPASFNPCPDG